jgi:hypothetical protein
MNSRAAKREASTQLTMRKAQWRAQQIGDIGMQIEQSGHETEDRNVGNKRSRLGRVAEVPYDGCIAVLKDAHAVYVLFIRACQQTFRDWRGDITDMFLYLFAGTLLGFVFLDTEFIGPLPKYIQDQCPEPIRPLCALPRSNNLPIQSSFSVLAIGLLGMVAARPYFGRDLAHGVWARESEGGTPTVSYFIAKELSQAFIMLLAPAAFTLMFYSVLQPRALMVDMYLLFLAVTFTAFGFGNLVSVVADERASLLCCIVLQLIFTMMSGVTPDLRTLYENPFTWFLSVISFARWAQEAYVVDELRYYENLYNLTTTYEMLMYQSDEDQYDFCIRNVLICGGVAHACTLLVLLGKKYKLVLRLQIYVLWPLRNRLTPGWLKSGGRAPSARPRAGSAESAGSAGDYNPATGQYDGRQSRCSLNYGLRGFGGAGSYDSRPESPQTQLSTIRGSEADPGMSDDGYFSSGAEDAQGNRRDPLTRSVSGAMAAAVDLGGYYDGSVDDGAGIGVGAESSQASALPSLAASVDLQRRKCSTNVKGTLGGGAKLRSASTAHSLKSNASAKSNASISTEYDPRFNPDLASGSSRSLGHPASPRRSPGSTGVQQTQEI